MATTHTVTAEPHGIPMTEVELQPVPPAEETTEAPVDAVEREASTPIFKLGVAGFSFFCAGVNDGTLGPLIPYILSTFRIGTGEISIIYGTAFLGWLLAAITNPILTAHLTLGQILSIGAALQLISQCLRPWSPFPLFCITFFLQALGMAYQDSHSNTFVSGLKNVPHRWLGFIHASYALGLFVGPLIATGIANAQNLSVVDGWRRVYFVLIGIGVVNVAGVVAGFGDTFWSRPGSGTPGGDGGGGELRKKRIAFGEMRDLMKLKIVWLLSLFYFFELGSSATAGGWVVEFLTTVRGGRLSQMGYVPTGYSGGLFLGRLLLAEPTFRFGEQRMLLVYSVICVALQLVFWLQPNIIASATALSLMGFFFGPFFATGMSVASKVFPKNSQSAALGFVFVLAQAGAAIFPSVTGLIATSAGVGVLQPIVLALLVAGGVCWWLIPAIPDRSE